MGILPGQDHIDQDHPQLQIGQDAADAGYLGMSPLAQALTSVTRKNRGNTLWGIVATLSCFLMLFFLVLVIVAAADMIEVGREHHDRDAWGTATVWTVTVLCVVSLFDNLWFVVGTKK